MHNKLIFITLLSTICLAPQITAMQKTWQEHHEDIHDAASTNFFTLSQEEFEIIEEDSLPSINNLKLLPQHELNNQLVDFAHCVLDDNHKPNAFLRCKMLLLAGADVNGMDKEGKWTPLTASALQGYPHRIKLFIAHGANLNLTSSFGTALFAGARQSFRITLLLLENGADLNMRHFNEKSAIHEAVSNSRGDLCITILRYQLKLKEQMKTALLCLHRMRTDPQQPEKTKIISHEMYRNFNTLLRPHIGIFIPLTKLLNMRDAHGKRACDYAQNDFLNPDKVYTALDALEKLQPGSFSNCTIL